MALLFIYVISQMSFLIKMSILEMYELVNDFKHELSIRFCRVRIGFQNLKKGCVYWEGGQGFISFPGSF